MYCVQGAGIWGNVVAECLVVNHELALQILKKKKFVNSINIDHRGQVQIKEVSLILL